MADLRITDLPELLATQLQGTDPVAIVDLSASTTKKITVENLIQDGINLLPDGSIPGDKVNSSIELNSISGDVLIDNSVTAQKLADNSSCVVAAALPASGEFIGQHAFITGGTTNVLYTWDGTDWLVEGIITGLTGDDTGLVNIYVSDGGGQTLAISADLDETTAASQFLAGPASGPGEITPRIIVSEDLPTAGTDKGAVAVNGNGLDMDGDDIAIDNAVVQNTGAGHLVQYNEFGLVTGGAAITSADLPTATDSEKGAVRPGTGLSMDGSGALNHTNSVVGGTATKITFDTEGHVTQGQALDADDIPNLPADKITSGDFGTNFIADEAITAAKLADYSTCLMQEANPGAGDFLGQFWYTPSTAQLRVYARGSGPENIWLPVGFGNLQANNLRWLGTYNADTDTIGSLTAIGVSEGLTAGDPFPAPTDALSGGYFICQVAGSSMAQPNLNGISHTGGDWALCLDEAQGWIHIDAAAGGGGGGGAQYLDDLLDVNIGGSGSPFSTAPAMALSDKQLLKYDGGAGLWRNTDRVDGGTF